MDLKGVVAGWGDVDPVLEATRAGVECETAWPWSVVVAIRTTDIPARWKTPVQRVVGPTYSVKARMFSCQSL